MKSQGDWDITEDLTVSGTVTINDYRLPLTDGTTGQVIQTDGAGILTFQDASGSVSAGDVKLLAEVFAL